MTDKSSLFVTRKFPSDVEARALRDYRALGNLYAWFAGRTPHDRVA